MSLRGIEPVSAMTPPVRMCHHRSGSTSFSERSLAGIEAMTAMAATRAGDSHAVGPRGAWSVTAKSIEAIVATSVERTARTEPARVSDRPVEDLPLHLLDRARHVDPSGTRVRAVE